MTHRKTELNARRCIVRFVVFSGFTFDFSVTATVITASHVTVHNKRIILLCTFSLREGGGTREARSTVAESRVVLYQVGTHQIRQRRRAARSLTSQGRAEPLCARIQSANREVSEGKDDI